MAAASSRSHRLRLHRLRPVLWRYRHVLAALCLAWAVVLVLPGPESARSAPEVVVTARDVPAGTTLTAEQLTTAAMASPPQAAVPAEQLIGERLAIGLPEGIPVVPAMLVGPGVAGGAPPGTVVAAVHLSDPALLQLITVGDRLELYSPGPGSDLGAEDAELITDDALVLSVLGTSEDASGLLTAATDHGDGAVLVAVAAEDASLLTGASGVSSFRAVVLPDG